MYKELTLFFMALMLVTIRGRPVSGAPQGYLKRAILSDIKILLHILPKDEDELYTPVNTEDQCARGAMICYMEEIGVLAQENEERPKISKTIQRMQRNIGAVLNYTSNTKPTGLNSIQPSEPSKVTLASFTSRREKNSTAQTNTCPPCESYPLQKTTDFLKRMIQFVQFALDDSGFKEH